MQESALKSGRNDIEELSKSMFLNVITNSFLVIFPKLFRDRGVARFFHFMVMFLMLTIQEGRTTPAKLIHCESKNGHLYIFHTNSTNLVKMSIISFVQGIAI